MAKRDEKGMNPFLAGVVGAAAGAAGAAATMALTNKKTRDQIGETFSDLRDQVVARVKEYTESPEKMKTQTRHAAKKVSSTVRGTMR